jgi:16S rRNA (guanine966-N2)-methyltransferase
MRITGGIYRGRKLHLVQKKTTRETADMVKVAVFNMLGNNLSGVALDLFAGSGAYGIESLSRGVDFVYFNDIDKDASRTIEKNVMLINELNKSSIHNLPYEVFLSKLDQSIRFDYVFLDPPYEMTIYKDLFSSLEKHMQSNSKIIIEANKDYLFDDQMSSFVKTKEKVYGIKKIAIYSN